MRDAQVQIGDDFTQHHLVDEFSIVIFHCIDNLWTTQFHSRAAKLHLDFVAFTCGSIFAHCTFYRKWSLRTSLLSGLLLQLSLPLSHFTIFLTRFGE